MELYPHQLEVISECEAKGSGGLSLPMGFGKTAIGMTLGLRFSEMSVNSPLTTVPVSLIVVAKGLIPTWQTECEKFYPDVGVEIFHTEFLKKKIDSWQPKPETRFVLTTPETLVKYFKQYNVEEHLVWYERTEMGQTIKQYNEPNEPFLSHPFGGGLLFSIRWACLIVDEISTHNNSTTAKCQALASICAPNRWGLSGTLFPEPTTERILGYHLILDLPAPRNLPGMKEYLRSPRFGGLDATTVQRDKNPVFVEPEINQEYISHTLSDEEASIYIGMRKIMTDLNKKVAELRAAHDVEGARRFSAYRLAMLTYLRQGMICPIIPVASAAVDIINKEQHSELARTLTERVARMGLSEWLNNLESICSTRIQHILQKIDEHENERILIFGCYRSCLELLKAYLTHRPVFALDATMKIQKRKETLDAFAASENGILLLTYQIGSMGLNLQSATTVILTDMAWNRDISRQAVARMLRFGQLANKVNIIMFTSNTGIEKALLVKHEDKLLLYQDLKSGPSTRKISKIDMNEIIRILGEEENPEILLRVESIRT